MKLLKARMLLNALFLVSAAFGSNVTFNSDENCNGSLVRDLNTFVVPCSLSNDPVSGATTVLYRLLGSGVKGLVSGDVLILDSSSQIPYLLRFNADVGHLFTFSNDTGSLADVGMPFPDITSSGITIHEVDLGGGILGVNHQPPDLGSPGLLDVNPRGVTYSFVSGAETSNVPEPAMYLMIAGFLLLICLRWRKLRTFKK